MAHCQCCVPQIRPLPTSWSTRALREVAGRLIPQMPRVRVLSPVDPDGCPAYRGMPAGPAQHDHRGRCGEHAGSALPASAGDRKRVLATALRVQEFDKGRGPVGFPPIGQACDLPVEPDEGPREGSLVKFRGGRSARCRCPPVMVALVWGVAESAPCALICWPGAAGHAGRRGRELSGGGIVVQRFGLVAFLCGVTSRGGRGAGPGSSQPYLGPRGVGAAPAT